MGVFVDNSYRKENIMVVFIFINRYLICWLSMLFGVRMGEMMAEFFTIYLSLLVYTVSLLSCGKLQKY